MQQENRSFSPSYSKPHMVLGPTQAKESKPPKGPGGKPAAAPQGSPRPAAKAQAGVKPAETLTAMMLDYRSWWNLPRARSKKPA